MELKARDLVASAQRRTATRREAHFEVCHKIDSFGLPVDEALALKVDCYRYLFPEYAHVIEPHPGATDA